MPWLYDVRNDPVATDVPPDDVPDDEPDDDGDPDTPDEPVAKKKRSSRK